MLYCSWTVLCSREHFLSSARVFRTALPYLRFSLSLKQTNKQKKGQFYSSQGSVFSFMFPVFNGSVRVFTPSWPLEIINLEIACRSSELVTCKGLALESAGVPTSSSPRSSCGVSWNKRPALNKRPHLLLFMCDFGMQGLL